MTTPESDNRQRAESATSATRRLHRLISACQEQGRKQGSGTSIENILKTVLSAPLATTRDMFEAHAAIVRLNDAAIDEVRSAFPTDGAMRGEMDNALAPLVELRRILLDTSVTAAVTPWLKYNVSDLNQAAAWTSLRLTGHDATDEELKLAREQLDQALELVLASNASHELKELFRAGTAQLKLALDRYRIFGAGVVLDELGEMVARVYTSPEARADTSDTIGQAMTKVADATTVIINSAVIVHFGLPIVAAGIRLLGGH